MLVHPQQSPSQLQVFATGKLRVRACSRNPRQGPHLRHKRVAFCTMTLRTRHGKWHTRYSKYCCNTAIRQAAHSTCKQSGQVTNWNTMDVGPGRPHAWKEIGKQSITATNQTCKRQTYMQHCGGWMDASRECAQRHCLFSTRFSACHSRVVHMETACSVSIRDTRQSHTRPP